MKVYCTICDLGYILPKQTVVAVDEEYTKNIVLLIVHSQSRSFGLGFGVALLAYLA